MSISDEKLEGYYDMMERVAFADVFIYLLLLLLKLFEGYVVIANLVNYCF